MIGYDELAEAARYNDARAEEGSPVGMGVFGRVGIDPEAAMKVAEQRGLRAYMLMTNQLAEWMAGEPIPVTNRALLTGLIVASYDGIALGAHAIVINGREDRRDG